MLNFVTLFDNYYYSRGLAMFQSLKAVCPNFHLYIVTFDDETAARLSSLKESKLTVITLTQLETHYPSLLSVKPTRTRGEYCWTSTGFTISYCLEKYSLDHCIYLDADIFFYADPNLLWQEMAETDHVLITEHRYSPHYDQTKTSGRFCVQFLGFKNSPQALTVLEDWKGQCLEWCYAILDVENDRFGDQKYLDPWPVRFKGIHILNHLGGGLAPWNSDGYKLYKKRGCLYVKLKSGENEAPLVFYHFHSTSKQMRYVSTYYIPYAFEKYLYSPYIKTIFSKEVNSRINPTGYLIKLFFQRTFKRVKSLSPPC